MKSYYIYIMTNFYNTVLYTGVSNDLTRRVFEHKNKTDPASFTSRYNVNKLVYFEECGEVEDAIAREKQIKGWTRNKKIELIENINPSWEDMS